MNTEMIETVLQEKNSTEFFNEQWYPCSRDVSIEQFFLSGQNGPFLRPLYRFWLDLDSPKLDIVERIKKLYLISEEGHLLSKDLMVLVNSQEQTVWKLIHETLQFKTDQSNKAFRTFEAFASQLNLFSMIKSELIQIERSRCGEEHVHFHHVYQAVWQSHLEIFEQGRKYCRKQGLHLCIGELIWGDCYRVPLEMLKYSFQGYLMQENKRFETLLKPFDNREFVALKEPFIHQSKVYRFDKGRKRRDAYIPVDDSLDKLGDTSEVTGTSLPILISDSCNKVRSTSPERMTEDNLENIDENIVQTSSIKWRTRLWTLTLTTPHRTYSIEISPKGSTGLSRTDGIFFPLQPMRTLSNESNKFQVEDKRQAIERQTSYESSQQLIQHMLAQLPEINSILPYGTVTQIDQQSTETQFIREIDQIGEGPFHSISSIL